MVRDFDLGDILSVTTDRLVSPRHIEGVYDILNFLTGATLFTHQLPRASRTCRPHILTQHPQLTGQDMQAAVQNLDTLLARCDTDETRGTIVRTWLAAQKRQYGETLPLTPLAGIADDYATPIADLVEMIGPEKILIVEL